MLPFIRRPKSLVGLDIHSDEIRLLQLKLSRSAIYIERIAHCDLPRNAIFEGKIQDAKLVRECIAYLVSMAKVQNNAAAIALPVHAIFSKLITLPAKLDEKECEAEIIANLNDYFPGMIAAELCFDYRIIEKPNTELKTIELTVARQDQVNALVNVVNQSGLQVEVVDVDTFAMVDAMTILQPDPTVKALLEINPSGVRLIVIENQEIIFSHLLMSAYFNLLEAELIQQLKKSLQICFSTLNHMQINTLFLFGKVISTELSRLMEKELNVSVEQLNPFSTMKLGSMVSEDEVNRIASRMLTCCGLALRSVVCRK